MFVLVVLFLIPFPALAYLDLGSGSYFIQMFLALLFAVSLSVKTFWYRIFSLFRGKKKDANKKEQAPFGESDGREE
jgi:hypothetical protein